MFKPVYRSETTLDFFPEYSRQLLTFFKKFDVAAIVAQVTAGTPKHWPLSQRYLNFAFETNSSFVIIIIIIIIIIYFTTLRQGVEKSFKIGTCILNKVDDIVQSNQVLTKRLKNGSSKVVPSPINPHGVCLYFQECPI